MNKKLLGIAAVALLGVSAAFAATTSTVYFTASGTLTKVEEEGYGILSYQNIISNEQGDELYAIKKYQGVEIIDGNNEKTACTVVLDDSTKVENINTSSKEDYPYLYTKVTLSDLQFEKAGDYVVIPFFIGSKNSNEYTYNYEHSIKRDYLGSAGNSNSSICGYSDLTIEGDDASLFTVRIGDDAKYMLDPSITKRYYSYYTNATYTYSSTSEVSTCTTEDEGFLFVSIQLKEDVTTAKKFSSLSFSLPEFTKISA